MKSVINIQKFEVDLKQYEVIRPFSQGGIGCLYLIKKKNANEYYIAKVLQSKHLNNDFFREENKREIEIMCLCQHPTIVKCYGYSKTDFDGNDNYTIIMEYVKNGSLDDLIFNFKNKKASIQYDNTMKTIILIGSSFAMSLLHKLHIIHRDFKPANILISKEGYPLLIDFNLSKFWKTNESFVQSTNCGTPFYMANEILSFDKNYNYKVDVYAFGITMIQVLIDEIPNSNKDIDIILNDIFLPKLNKMKIKKPLLDLIYKCISKNYEERPEFSEILEKLSDLSNDDYLLDDVDKKKVSSYIKLITQYDMNIDILALKIVLNDLTNQNQIFKKDIKQIDSLKNCLKRFRTDIEKLKKKDGSNLVFQNETKEINQDLIQRVKKLEDIVYNLDKIYITIDNLDKMFISIKNLEKLLQDSPLITKLSENVSNLSNDMNQIKSNMEKMNQNNIEQNNLMRLELDQIKNDYKIVIQNMNNKQPRNDSNQNNSLMQLIQKLQQNVSSLDTKFESSQAKMDILEKQFNQYRIDYEKERDEYKNLELNALLSKIQKLESDSVLQKQKIDMMYNKEKNQQNKQKKYVNINDDTENNSNTNSNNQNNNDHILNLIGKLEKEISDLKKKCSQQEHIIQQTQQLYINNGNNYDKCNFIYDNSQTINHIENNQNLFSRFEKMEETINGLIQENKDLRQQIKNIKEKKEEKTSDKSDDAKNKMIKDLQNKTQEQERKNDKTISKDQKSLNNPSVSEYNKNNTNSNLTNKKCQKESRQSKKSDIITKNPANSNKTTMDFLDSNKTINSSKTSCNSANSSKTTIGLQNSTKTINNTINTHNASIDFSNSNQTSNNSNKTSNKTTNNPLIPYNNHAIHDYSHNKNNKNVFNPSDLKIPKTNNSSKNWFNLF